MIESKPATTRVSLLLLALCGLLLTTFAFSHELLDGQKNRNDNRPPKNSNAPPPAEKPSLPPSKPGNTNANKPRP